MSLRLHTPSRVRRIAAAGGLLALTGSVATWAVVPAWRPFATGSAAQAPGKTIQHIVFIMEENRSYDNVFGRFPGADGATTATGYVNGHLTAIPLVPEPTYLWHDIGHDVPDTLAATNKGKMNGFSGETYANILGDQAAYQQLTSSQIPNLYAYAKHYTLSDRTFAPMAGPTMPVHMHMVAADSQGVVSNPQQAGSNWGCDAPKQAYVLVQKSATTFAKQYPCFATKTMVDAFNSAHVSWRYYAAPASDAGYIWSTLDAYKQVRESKQWTEGVVDENTFAKDARTGHLPAFSWVTPRALDSMHPPNTACAGENWIVDKVNAVMQGPDWAHTLIVVAWDDWGGYYDHVAPPAGMGIRVPMLLISPYAKQGYVSHTVYSFESVLKTAEEVWHLPALTKLDRTAHDLLDSLNFSGKPAPKLVLKTRACPAPLTDATDLALLNNILKQDLTQKLTLPYPQIEALHRTHSFKDLARLRGVDPLTLLHDLKGLASAWAGGRVLLNLTPAADSDNYTNTILRALDHLYKSGPSSHLLPIKPVK